MRDELPCSRVKLVSGWTFSSFLVGVGVEVDSPAGKRTGRATIPEKDNRNPWATKKKG